MEDKQPQVKTGHAVQQLPPAQHDGEISNQLGNSTSLPVYRHEEPHEEQIGAKEQPLSRAAAIFSLAVLVPVSGAVFAVMAVNQSSIANDQSQVANQIALLSMCYTNSSTAFCSRLLGQADDIVAQLAKKLYQGESNGNRIDVLESEGGKPFLLSSVITFWVLMAVSVVCTLWYSGHQVWAWRLARVQRKHSIAKA